MAPLFAVRHAPTAPANRFSMRSLQAVPRLDPIMLKSAGATPDMIWSKPMHVHPNFGALSPWGSTASPLPPVNCEKAKRTPAADRLAARISWGLPAQHFGNGMAKGERALHLGATIPYRLNMPQPRFPASPNPHCSPTPPLPPSPRLRAKTTHVHKSTHPMLRLPPHTSTERQLRLAIYGPPPANGKWDDS